MSKSLGNGIDPLEVIDQFGADALRFMLTTGITPGNDMRFKEDKLESSRNFANKLWNASRFVIMNLQDEDGNFKELAKCCGDCCGMALSLIHIYHHRSRSKLHSRGLAVSTGTGQPKGSERKSCPHDAF